MTSSGYPRIVKQWKRGTPLSAATRGVRRQAGRHVHRRLRTTTRPGFERDFVSRTLAFYNDELYLRGKRRQAGQDRRAQLGQQVGAQATG